MFVRYKYLNVQPVLHLHSEHEHEVEVVGGMPAALEDVLPIAVGEGMAVVQEDIGLVYLDLAEADTSSCHHREEHRVVVRAEIVARIPSTPAAEGKVDGCGLPFMRS